MRHHDSFQKVKRSALPKYLPPPYKSIDDDYTKLGYILSSPKSPVFSFKENCIYRQAGVLQTEPCNSCALLRDRPAILYTTGGTKPCRCLSISWSLLPVRCLTMRYHTLFHATCRDICSTRSMFCPCKLILLRIQLLSSSCVCRNPFPHPTTQSWHYN